MLTYFGTPATPAVKMSQTSQYWDSIALSVSEQGGSRVLNKRNKEQPALSNKDVEASYVSRTNQIWTQQLAGALRVRSVVFIVKIIAFDL